MTIRERKQIGSAIVEGSAGLMILIPMIIMITYVILEVSHAYFIWSALQQGARQAAQLIMSDPNVTSPTAANPAQAIQNDLSQISIPNVIVSPQQFTPAPQITYIPNQFAGQQTSATQAASLVGSVQVTVKYTSGQYGLPTFPDADVLNLGSSFVLTGTAVCNTPN